MQYDDRPPEEYSPDDLTYVEQMVLQLVIRWMSPNDAFRDENGDPHNHSYPIGVSKPRNYLEHFHGWGPAERIDGDETDIRQAVQTLNDAGLMKSIRLFKRTIDWAPTREGRRVGEEIAYSDEYGDPMTGFAPMEGGELVAHRFATEMEAAYARYKTRNDILRNDDVFVQPQVNHPEEELPPGDVLYGGHSPVDATAVEVICSIGDIHRLAAKFETLRIWCNRHPTVSLGDMHEKYDSDFGTLRVICRDLSTAAELLSRLDEDEALEVPAAPLEAEYSDYSLKRLNKYLQQAKEDGRILIDEITTIQQRYKETIEENGLEKEFGSKP